jgi:perosamine synthetase
MIPMFKVFMPKTVIKPLSKVLHSGYVAEGPVSKQFEEQIQHFIGNENTAIVNSATSAITIALRLCDVGPGTEVITSPQTCLATNEPILSLGADIVWCDVDINTGNIDPSKIEKLITNKTKAILFVDWVGIPAELDVINSIAKKHNIKTIEDAAQALGSCYRGNLVGNACDFTVFSFQAIKMLTTGDGGAISCKLKSDYEKACLLRWFGMERKNTCLNPLVWEGDVVHYGYKMNFNDISAIIGLEQLKYVNKNIEKNRKNSSMLLDMLSDIKNLKIVEVLNHIDPVFWVFPIQLMDSTHREIVSKKLLDNGISNSILHTRNDKYSIFHKYISELPNLDEFSSRMLNIPCGWWLSKDNIKHIVKIIKESI